MKLIANRYKLIAKSGFTLIELLVVLAIFIIITAVVLARQNRFSSDILLTDLAYQVGISIREAQVYGLGVRNSANTFNTGYGIEFNSSTPTSYLFFSDVNKDGVYESNAVGGPDVIVSTSQIQKGGTIANVCGTSDQNVITCFSSGVPNTPFDVVFIRPDPSAKIHSGIGNTYVNLVITVESLLKDRSKCVKVDQTGQVSVYNPPDPRLPTICSTPVSQ